MRGSWRTERGNGMKRLCIYLVYDKKGQVDRYVGYMLKELKSCVDTLLVVCNQKQILKGREWIEY